MARKRRQYKKKQSAMMQGFGNALSVATRALKIASFVKRQINVEKKYINVSSSSTGFASSATGTIVSTLSNTAQGLDITNRVGDSIKYDSWTFEAVLQQNVANTSLDVISVWLVKDLQPNATAPSWTDIFDNTTPACLCLRNPATPDRFIIMKHWMVNLEANGNTAHHLKYYYKFPEGKDSHAKYSGTASAIPYSNSLYLCFAGDVTANTSTIKYTSRVRFIDN